MWHVSPFLPLPCGPLVYPNPSMPPTPTNKSSLLFSPSLYPKRLPPQPSTTIPFPSTSPDFPLRSCGPPQCVLEELSCREAELGKLRERAHRLWEGQAAGKGFVHRVSQLSAQYLALSNLTKVILDPHLPPVTSSVTPSLLPLAGVGLAMAWKCSLLHACSTPSQTCCWDVCTVCQSIVVTLQFSVSVSC